VSTPIQNARPSYTPIHYSAVFPVVTLPCESTDARTPATDVWAYVTCRRCLVEGAKTDHEARVHLARRDAERAAARAADEV
jgi:hypothetical protein